MKLDSLETLFAGELADLRSAESQLIKALPKMAKAANSPKLKQAFEGHLEETKAQAERLDEIIQSLDRKVPSKKCKAMEGLIEEGSEVVSADGDPAVIDAALIASAQRVEHYEIAAYGCARTFAELLGLTDAAKLLEESLEEEKQADIKLTKVAKSIDNSLQAAAP